MIESFVKYKHYNKINTLFTLSTNAVLRLQVICKDTLSLQRPFRNIRNAQWRRALQRYRERKRTSSKPYPKV